MSYLQKKGLFTIVASNYTIAEVDEIICLNNLTTSITITFPSAESNLGRTIRIFRYSGSTGGVTLTCQSGERLQSITGTIGITSSIAGHGANGQGVYHFFTAIKVGAIFVWCRI